MVQVSSVEIERVCNSVDDRVLETAAIGVTPAGGGPERLVIVVIFKDANGSNPDLNKLKASLNTALQKKLNPLFKVSFYYLRTLLLTKFEYLENFYMP